MKPQFRILENKDGKYEIYYVDSISLRGKEKLKPFITWSGLDKVYSFRTIESAVDNLKLESIRQLERAERKNYEIYEK